MNTRFEPGTRPAGGAIPLSVPEIRGNEWNYVKQCLDTGWVSSVGEFVNRFESDLARRVGVPHAVATASGTAALHIALLLAGVGPDDEVVLPSLTFIAPANAIRYVGAFPLFVDSEPEFFQLDVDKLQQFFQRDCTFQNNRLINRATGRTIKALMPVHILGHPVNMKDLSQLAQKYHLRVIEDATESLGARFERMPVGSIGDIACFSFNGNKLITTGGGGMLVTKNSDWAERARYLTTQAKDDPVEFIHNEIGYNYRLTNVQAAIGCAQLENLDSYIAKKRSIASLYSSTLSETPGFTVMKEAPWAFSVFWMYTALLNRSPSSRGRKELAAFLQENKVQTRPLWQPLHLSPAHRDSFAADCSTAGSLNNYALSLPCSVGLTSAEQERVISLLRQFTH